MSWAERGLEDCWGWGRWKKGSRLSRSGQEGALAKTGEVYMSSGIARMGEGRLRRLCELRARERTTA